MVVTHGDRKLDMEDVDIPVLPTQLLIKSEDDGWVAYPKSHAERLDKTYNQKPVYNYEEWFLIQSLKRLHFCAEAKLPSCRRLPHIWFEHSKETYVATCGLSGVGSNVFN